jgi:hypothetical protein
MSSPTTGACYLNYKRAVLNTPHPMYGGGLEGFGVGDLDSAFELALPIFPAAITADSTSLAIEVAANAIAITAQFSDLHTGCSILVFLADGVTKIAEFDNVSALNADKLYVGFAQQRVVIGGGALIFQVTNWSGTGSLTLGVRRTG